MQIQKSRSEQAKFDFVSGLMQYNSTGLGKAMTEFLFPIANLILRPTTH